MNRTLIGILLGAVIVAAALGAATMTGWVTIGRPVAEMADTQMDDMEAAGSPASADEHAGHDMSTMPAEPAAQGGDTAAGQPGMEGMDMGGAESGGETAGDMPANAVMISPERQQLIGLRTARVERRNLDQTIRTVGVVEYDERRVAHIHTKVSGWIEQLDVDFTGELVEEGQRLLEIYSPELLSTQEEYLLALRARGTLGNSRFDVVRQSSDSLLEATRRRLELWDIPDEQIMALEEQGVPFKTLPVYSPIRGFVIHKAAYEGQHVGPEAELYTIADLREVWITADIYEYELPLISVGQRAEVTLPYFPGERFSGRVDYIYPYLEGETRTAKARLVFANPDWKLKPDMYANVVLTAELGEGLVIPEDAVIDTGVRQVAFRALPGGHFQPVEIQTGVKVGDWLQVLSGLDEDEEIVTGAAFLVDSESRLGSAMRAMPGMHH
ncbi:MAG: efflux RND transporter periplasmic adaptor subunit [Acidobacteriota bacterium]|jgi:multidrug efflux pump subunit AcrA (membrane-fusion protein)